MNKKKLLFIIPLCFLVLFNGKKYDEAVKERLFLPIKLCLEGEDCGTVSQASQMSANVSQSEVKKVENWVNNKVGMFFGWLAGWLA